MELTEFNLAEPKSMIDLADLETRAQQQFTDIMIQFDEAVQDGTDITEYDPQGPDSIDNEKFMAYLDELRSTFFSDDESEEAYLTTYRAVSFACVLSEVLTANGTWGVNYDHIQLQTDSIEFELFAREESEKYLDDRAKIDLLVGNYLHLISPQVQYAASGRQIVGFQLLAVDRYLQLAYSQDELADFGEFMKVWDFTFPDKS